MEIIHTHTRQQEFEDGTLIDVTDYAEFEGFGVPVAFTSGFYAEAILAPCRGDNMRIDDRVHEVLSDIMDYIKFASRKGLLDEPRFGMSLPTSDGEGVEYTMACKVHSSPGDHGEHVLTVMLGDED